MRFATALHRTHLSAVSMFGVVLCCDFIKIRFLFLLVFFSFGVLCSNSEMFYLSLNYIF